MATHFGGVMSRAPGNSRERVRVLIADADYMGSQLMASALTRCRNEFEVVGIAGNSLDVVRQVEVCKPDVALLSTGLQDGAQSGLAVLQTLRDSHARTAPVMLLHSLDRDTVVDAFRGGARGIISRSDSFKSLAKCIRCVHHGQIWANNSQIEYLLEALTQLKPRLSKSGGIALLRFAALMSVTRCSDCVANCAGVPDKSVSLLSS